MTLDDAAQLRAADSGNFLERLLTLPGSYDGPDGERPEPYGLMAFGEAAVLARVLSPWVDAPLVVTGTQFLLAAGFDHGEVASLRVNAELSEADVVVLGHVPYGPDLFVARHATSAYTYAAYLARATGHGRAFEELEAAMAALAGRLGPDVATEGNPAKALAWALWNRAPLLVASRTHAGLPELVQLVFARIGKSLALTAGDHPLGVLSGALEARHVLGDDLVGVLLGDEDASTALAREVLETRVAQVETLGAESFGLASVPADPVARSLLVWYASLFVATYVALLHDRTPEDTAVYEALYDAS